MVYIIHSKDFSLIVKIGITRLQVRTVIVLDFICFFRDVYLLAGKADFLVHEGRNVFVGDLRFNLFDSRICGSFRFFVVDYFQRSRLEIVINWVIRNDDAFPALFQLYLLNVKQMVDEEP